MSRGDTWKRGAARVSGITLLVFAIGVVADAISLRAGLVAIPLAAVAVLILSQALPGTGAAMSPDRPATLDANS